MITIGKYSYSSKTLLGVGSFGKVYEGKNNKTQEKVAIKVIYVKQLPKQAYYQTQLSNEIKSLKSLNHKNVLHLFEVINQNDNCYIITEFCEEGSLKEKITGVIPEQEALRIYTQLLDGFRELLKKNIIHRDLKPANILFQKKICKLADFGFSRFVDDFNTSLLKSFVGSPLYMAPQILQNQKYSTKCDVWSLGVILYEMLFGRTPWIGIDERDLLNNILTKPLIFKPNVKISELTESILKRSLVISEEKRICWEELFKLCSGKKGDEEEYEEMRKKIENNRNLSGFLHFVSFEIFNNYVEMRNLSKNKEFFLEKFLICLAFYVKKLCEQNLGSVQQLKKNNKFRAQHSKILNAFSEILQKELKFFSDFLKDLIVFFTKEYILDSLKQNAKILDLFNNFSNKNFDVKTLNNMISELGKAFLEKNLGELGKIVKKNHLGERGKMLNCLKCIDFILDTVLLMGKESKVMDFRKIYEEKSCFSDEIVYLETLIDKQKKLL